MAHMKWLIGGATSIGDGPLQGPCILTALGKQATGHRLLQGLVLCRKTSQALGPLEAYQRERMYGTVYEPLFVAASSPKGTARNPSNPLESEMQETGH